MSKYILIVNIIYLCKAFFNKPCLVPFYAFINFAFNHKYLFALSKVSFLFKEFISSVTTRFKFR